MTQELLQWNPALAKEVDDSGSTPLHYVASAGNISASKLLLRYDTSPAYVPDSNGLFPVHIAAKMGYGQLIYELSKHCPDFDEKLDSKGRNFLHIAVEHKKWKVVWHFSGTPELARMINVMDYEGNTALHLAVKNADQMIVSLLMSNKGLLPNIVNNQGLTALDLAVLATDKGISYTLVIFLVYQVFLFCTCTLLVCIIVSCKVFSIHLLCFSEILISYDRIHRSLYFAVWHGQELSLLHVAWIIS
jgi:ankyrin repeat protein